MEMTGRKFAKHFSGIASFSYRPYKDDFIRLSKSSVRHSL